VVVADPRRQLMAVHLLKPLNMVQEALALAVEAEVHFVALIRVIRQEAAAAPAVVP